ncbi:MAG: indole-3-glycerol phosphate synthase TrpC [Chloroflexota bacterium]|nr:indole-3-glycerol phosphate synthase TrpC [Chloroflexota bacterium]
MTDFLEEVGAERRAYVMETRPRVSEQDVLSNMRDNLWARARAAGALDALRNDGALDAFTSALALAKREGHLAVIAEVKRVSPAQGVLGADVDVVRLARAYVTAGATAISVVTEPKHWGGSLRDLEAVRDAVDVPILYKDVVVTEYQVLEARKAGADAALLIAEALHDEDLSRVAKRAADLDMGVLVEAHEPAAFERTVDFVARAGIRIVGINARNLRRPSEIDLDRVGKLHALARDDQILVAESGIANLDDARRLPERVDAVLVGTALMRAADPGPLIAGLASIRRRR